MENQNSHPNSKNESFFIVFAHPEKSSFCSALKEKTLSLLQKFNKQTFESDLYATNFNPCISSKDFLHVPQKPSTSISLELEQKKSAELNTLAPDICLELEKLSNSNFVIFIAPLFWGTVPAIMKGWFDRVLVRGKTWDINKWHENGLLKGKKALLVLTIAGLKEGFKEGEFQNNSIENMLHHITWSTLRFCGMEVKDIYAIYGVGLRPKEEMEGELERYGEYIEGICINKL